MHDLSRETPVDQEWVHCAEFEQQLYDPGAVLPEAAPLTQGPRSHWFGYYDQFQTDPSDRFVLAMESAFEARSPGPDDEIAVGMLDTASALCWIPLGTSRAWCWQQGCTLQWRPGSDREVLWKDRFGDRFVCHAMQVDTRDRVTVEHPVYHVNPDGQRALTLDFARALGHTPHCLFSAHHYAVLRARPRLDRRLPQLNTRFPGD